MARRTRIALALPLLLAGLALSACQGTPPTPTEDPGATLTAEPTEEPAGPVFALPADCEHIASAATLASVFGEVDSRDPADLTRPAPASASKQLTCSWFAGDVTGGDVIYYTAPQADGEAYLDVVAADGYTCTEAVGGTRCDKLTSAGDFPVDTYETVFTRDDTWIYISLTNLGDGAALLPDIVATAWAA
jgi:hypothetical protein